jgi:hypothetical protein
MGVEGMLKRKQQHREQGIQRPEGGPLHFSRAFMPALMHRSQTIHVLVAISKAGRAHARCTVVVGICCRKSMSAALSGVPGSTMPVEAGPPPIQS